MKKHRAHGAGSIFKRGAGYSVRWMAGGRVTVRALRDSEGRPVKTMREAELAAEALLSPYRLANEAETALALASRADTIMARVDQLNAEANPGTLLRHGWAAFLRAPNRPDSGPSTLAGYEGQFENFAKWIAKRAPDCKRLNEVTVKHATDFAAHVEKGRSPSTFNQYMNTLDLVWRTLATGARITDNPWRPDRITRKRVSTNGAKGISGRRELTLPELKAIIDQASGEYRTLLAIGLYTGLRLGDAVRLDWSEIDLQRSVIVTVPRKTSRTSGSTVAIPISGAFRRELEALGPLTAGPVLPGLAKSYERDRSTVTVGVLDLFERAGVKTSVAVPGRKRAVMIAGFHSLRHSFITNAALLGWPEALVRSIVGHTSGAVTRRYIHLGVAAVKSLPAMPDPLALPAATELRRDPLPDWAREILEKSTVKTWRRDRAALLEG